MQTHFNIVQLFVEAALKNPEGIAIVHKSQEITYGKLLQEVRETSELYTGKGIAKGDKVLVFVPMSIDLYRTVLSLFYIGAVPVFLDEWVSISRLRLCLTVVQCKAFIGPLKLRIIGLLIPEIFKIKIRISPGYKSLNSGRKEWASTELDDSALITFTTGSTGQPKAANRTHGLLYEQFKALRDIIQPSVSDINMTTLPIVLLINLGVGSSSTIPKFKVSKHNAKETQFCFHQMKQSKTNTLVTSPFFIRKMAEYLLEHHQSLPDLQKIFTGGAPVFFPEIELYKNAFPQAAIEIIYGSTEAEPISRLKAEQIERHSDEYALEGLNVGSLCKESRVCIIPIMEAQVVINSENELDRIRLAPGQIGEIIVSGPHVLRDYIDNPEAVKLNKIFINGICWHRTGDSGFLDDAGNLFLTGRCNTLIYKDEKIISPFVYEGLFQHCKSVEIGTIMEINGNVTGIIELKKNFTSEAFRTEISTLNLPISEYKFVNKIPRDPRHNSKIDYAGLKVKIQGG